MSEIKKIGQVEVAIDVIYVSPSLSDYADSQAINGQKTQDIIVLRHPKEACMGQLLYIRKGARD